MAVSFRNAALPLIIGSLLAGGCESGSTIPNQAGTARLSVKLTDAPGDLEAAWVQIDGITLMGTTAADSASGRQELTPTLTGWVNLLELSGGKLADLVGDVPVPPGTYRQVRLVLGAAYIETEDGRIFATRGAELPTGVAADGLLQCPSCSSSGLKVKLPGNGVELTEGVNTLVIDFDVQQSFGHEAGRSGRWIMRPVLHAVRADGGARAGAIGGSVTLASGVSLPACGGETPTLVRFVPLATAAGDTLPKSGVTTVGAGGATYVVSPVAPGSHTLSADHIAYANGDTLRFTATATPATVTVAPGATAVSNFQVSAASCTAG